VEHFVYRLQLARPALLDEGPTPDEERALGEHFAYLAAANLEGTVVLAGRTEAAGADTFGIVVFRAEDTAAAQAFMAADPAVTGGVMTAALHPFRIALMGGWTTG
jgi:uncharacterized protein YciI